MPSEAIHIDGLKDFKKQIKQVDSDLPKALRIAFNQAAQIVADDAKSRVPYRSGKAAGSIKARSTQTAARVGAGGNRAAYYPWLDFGGRVGRRKSVQRPVKDKGRYLYQAYFDHRDAGDFEQALMEGLTQVAKEAGLEIEQ